MLARSEQPCHLSKECCEQLDRHVSLTDELDMDEITAPLSCVFVQCLKLVVESGSDVSDLIAYTEKIYPVSFWRLVSNVLALNSRKNTRELIRKNIAGQLTISTPPEDLWSGHFNAAILYVVTALTSPTKDTRKISVWESMERNDLGKIKRDQLFIRAFTIISISFFTMDTRAKFLLQETVAAGHRHGKGKRDEFLQALNVIGVATGVISSTAVTKALASKNEELISLVIKSAIRNTIPLALGFDNLDQEGSFGGCHVMAFGLFFLPLPLTKSPISYHQYRFQDLKLTQVVDNTPDEDKVLINLRVQLIISAVVAQRDERYTHAIATRMTENSVGFNPRSRKSVGTPKNQSNEDYAQTISTDNSGQMVRRMRSVMNDLSTIRSMNTPKNVVIQHSYSPSRHALTTHRDAEVISVLKGEVVMVIEQFKNQKVAVIKRLDGRFWLCSSIGDQWKLK